MTSSPRADDTVSPTVLTALCDPCTNSLSCVTPSDVDARCVAYGDLGSFCGQSCAANGDCPENTVCRMVSLADGGGALQCVMTGTTPDSFGNCPCSELAVAQKLSTQCGAQNAEGTCIGTRMCTESGLTECMLATPGPEICDGGDNDCNGQVDEGTCDDGNSCTVGSCNGVDGCSFAPVDGPCDDDNVCTENDACADGLCTAGTAVVCDDGDPCTKDTCDPVGGCQSEPLETCAPTCSDPSQKQCEPGQTESCDPDGQRDCGDDCLWGPCQTSGACIDGDSEACGNCGTRTCEGADWGRLRESGRLCTR